MKNLEFEDQESILQKAQKEYTIGTKFIDESGDLRIVTNDNHYCYMYKNLGFIVYCGETNIEGWDSEAGSNPHIYKNGKWMEIVN